MSQIKVKPESITGYASSAKGYFSAALSELGFLVRDVVGVHYEGGNAFTFKTEAGNISASFANSLAADIAAVAAAIGVSTGNILMSLGNDPVAVSVETEPFVAQVPEAKSETVDVDTDGLEALIPIVAAHFDTIRTALTDNQGALEETEWEGAAKTNALTQVTSFTTMAVEKANAAEESLTNYIRTQIDSAVVADA